MGLEGLCELPILKVSPQLIKGKQDPQQGVLMKRYQQNRLQTLLSSKDSNFQRDSVIGQSVTLLTTEASGLSDQFHKQLNGRGQGCKVQVPH